jgi:hypothetical protein
MRTWKRVAACIPITFLAMACASANAGRGAGGEKVTVEVTNHSQQIVNVFFLTETGLRVRIGTVSPSTSAVFFPRIQGMGPGYFHTHRLGERDRGVRIDGVADPGVIGGAMVQIRVGSLPQFDAWALRG